MQIDWVRESLDTIFSLLGKYARFLNAKGKRTCFLISNFSLLYWFSRDLYLGLYSQACFCFVSFGFNTYAYYNWKRKKIGEEQNIGDAIRYDQMEEMLDFIEDEVDKKLDWLNGADAAILSGRLLPIVRESAHKFLKRSGKDVEQQPEKQPELDIESEDYGCCRYCYGCFPDEPCCNCFDLYYRDCK